MFDLVADVDGEIVGHILLSALSAAPGALALAPVSVAPHHQRQGIGSGLIHHSIGRATAAGQAAIFLLGDPSYYTRFGFSLDAAESFETDYPREFFMALELKPDAFKSMPKKVEYPAAFRELGKALGDGSQPSASAPNAPLQLTQRDYKLEIDVLIPLKKRICPVPIPRLGSHNPLAIHLHTSLPLSKVWDGNLKHTHGTIECCVAVEKALARAGFYFDMLCQKLGLSDLIRKDPWNPVIKTCWKNFGRSFWARMTVDHAAT